LKNILNILISPTEPPSEPPMLVAITWDEKPYFSPSESSLSVKINLDLALMQGISSAPSSKPTQLMDLVRFLHGSFILRSPMLQDACRIRGLDEPGNTYEEGEKKSCST